MAIVLRKNPWFSIAKWNSLWDSLALLHNQKHLRYPTHITPCQRKNTTAATSPPIHTRRPEWPWGSRCLHIYIYYYYYFKKIKSCSNGQKKLAICHHLPPVPRSQVPPADAIDKLCCKVGFAGRGPRSNTNGEGKRRRGLFLKPSKK